MGDFDLADQCRRHGIPDGYASRVEAIAKRYTVHLGGQAPEPVDEWWCEFCEEYLSGSRVTFEERCDTCGHDATVGRRVPERDLIEARRALATAADEIDAIRTEALACRGDVIAALEASCAADDARWPTGDDERTELERLRRKLSATHDALVRLDRAYMDLAEPDTERPSWLRDALNDPEVTDG